MERNQISMVVVTKVASVATVGSTLVVVAVAVAQVAVA
jgi:hypothetical protein